jgi:hypothetical protein
MTSIRLRHLSFTGPQTETAELSFADGLNIVFGASNTGKSFVWDAVLFSLAAKSKLREIREIAAYDACWLTLSLDDDQLVTFHRPTNGGDVTVFDGVVTALTKGAGQRLRAKASLKRTDTVSHYLLNAMGLNDKQIVSDRYGKKKRLTISHLKRYMVVSESDIIDNRSPIYSGQYVERTFEENLFSLLLTGHDNSNVITRLKASDHRIASLAKLELIDDLLGQVNRDLEQNTMAEIEAREGLQDIDRNVVQLLGILRAVEERRDELVSRRISFQQDIQSLTHKVRNAELTIERFRKLNEAYESDRERLAFVVEGGAALAAFAEVDCPLCGALPESQRHGAAAADFKATREAAIAEGEKILVQQRALADTLAFVGGELDLWRNELESLSAELALVEQQLIEARPQSTAALQSYQQAITDRAAIVRVLELYDRRSQLLDRRNQISAKPAEQRVPSGVYTVHSDITANFNRVLKDILIAWRFPNPQRVEYDFETNDITVDGLSRSSNGTGVRAILHAAFKLAVILHARENKLPHPSFLVLDSPLLAYREPLKQQKYGELMPDEVDLKTSSLAQNFYKHLASLRKELQILVVENTDPPEAIGDIAKIATFTGDHESGRYGLLATYVEPD